MSANDRAQRPAPRGWRKLLQICAATIGVALVCNLVMLIFSLTQGHLPGDAYSRMLYHGDCAHTSKLSTWVHIAINIVSTLLLAASNSAVQILTAPTRHDVDAAHGSGRSMQIGSLSIRNLRHYGWKYKLLAALLGLSSVPLHFIYNSAVYPELGVMQYVAVIVSDDFSDPSANLTNYLYPNDNYESLMSRMQSLQRNGSLTHLTWPECVAEFRKGLIAYNQVIIMSMDSKNHNHPVQYVKVEQSDRGSFTTVQDTSDWLCEGYNLEQPTLSCLTNPGPSFDVYGDDDFLSVSSCDVLADDQQCSLNVNIAIMVTVIVCNIIKLGSVISMLRLRRVAPLVTIGDAISSFLSYDLDEDNVPLIPAEKILHDYHVNTMDTSRARFLRALSRYRLGAIGIVRWGVTLAICLFIWITGLALVAPNASSRASKWDLLNSSANEVIDLNSPVFQDGHLTSKILMANTPQFIVSYAYLIFNNSFTIMQTAVELARFASYPRGKPLRVSNPAEGQRATYFLQLPLRYTVPFMATMIALHWLLSEVLVMTNVRVYSYEAPNGQSQDTPWGGAGESMPFISWNAPAGIYALMVGGVLCVAFVVLGLRKMPGEMLQISTQSTVLKGLCSRRSDGEGPEIIYEPLKYGVLLPSETQSLFAGFTARVDEVQPLRALATLVAMENEDAAAESELFPLQNMTSKNGQSDGG